VTGVPIPRRIWKGDLVRDAGFEPIRTAFNINNLHCLTHK